MSLPSPLPPSPSSLCVHVRRARYRAHSLLGYCTSLFGKHEDAAASYRRSLELNPTDVSTRDLLRQARAAITQSSQGAAVDQAQALQVSPTQDRQQLCMTNLYLRPCRCLCSFLYTLSFFVRLADFSCKVRNWRFCPLP